MVKKYLTDKGIQEDRIKTFGFGCARMLFPEMRNEEEQRQNRRVEIVVLSF
jgi:outer membrane protein OmpA-like peptidoglycan-associated protein